MQAVANYIDSHVCGLLLYFMKQLCNNGIQYAHSPLEHQLLSGIIFLIVLGGHMQDCIVGWNAESKKARRSMAKLATLDRRVKSN